jgi:hypothetical protein
MQRQRRQLHQEGDQEAPHDQGRRRPFQRRPEQPGVVEGEVAAGAAVGEVERQDRQQHQQAAGLGEDEELRGRVDAPLVPPDRDQEIHGHQHQLPEEVEQEEVEGGEHADDPGQRPEQVEVEEPGPLADLAPRGQRGHQPQKYGQRHQQQAQAVEGQEEADAELGDPGPP